MNANEVLIILKSKIDLAAKNGVNYAIETEDIEMIEKALSLKIPKPEWLPNEDLDIALLYYNDGSKLAAVKHLYDIAKPYSAYPLRWAKEFIEQF